MSSYLWTQNLREIYDKAVTLYKNGNRELDSYFSNEEKEFLSSIGLRPINLYDYAEDMTNSSEPDWNIVLLMAAARRDYFLYHQHGKTSAVITEAQSLPPKPEELDGILWLPRIIKKAQCFLEGGLCHEIMYCCGGDRRFLKEHDIHPADFLRIVWASGGEKTKILDYLRKR
jgi:hypothetical protein